jgi:outer membrane protein TolC
VRADRARAPNTGRKESADVLPDAPQTPPALDLAPRSAAAAGTANTWSALGTVSEPLFQGGALVGQHREATAKHEEARLRYEQTALNGFQEVADVLVT